MNESSDSEVPALEIWGMRGIPLLSFLPGQFITELVASERVLSIGQIELFGIQTESKQMTYAELNW